MKTWMYGIWYVICIREELREMTLDTSFLFVGSAHLHIAEKKRPCRDFSLNARTNSNCCGMKNAVTEEKKEKCYDIFVRRFESVSLR